MARDDIKVEQLTIGELFSDRFAFQVPAYQRGYAWTTEHAAALLEDLLESLGEPTGGSAPVSGDESPYFLGSIVVIKGGSPDAQIVDGQQRLITLTILLAALRSLLPAQYSESLTRLIQAPADPLHRTAERYRLQPHERDADFFRRYIQDQGGIQRLSQDPHATLGNGRANMRANARHLLARLRGVSEEQRVRLAQYIVRRCLLVVVSAPTLSEAFRVFATLNNRGLDLTTADLLKAQIIGSLPGPEQDAYAARWDEIEEALGTERFQELPGYILPIYRRGQVSTNVLADFRRYVIEPTHDTRRLIDDVIVPYGQALRIVLMASYEHADAVKAERVNALLRWLHQIDNADWVAPAMLYFRRHSDTPERLILFLTKLERLAASLMIRRQFSDKRRQRYARLIAAICDGDDLAQRDSPIQLDGEERQNTIGPLSGDIYLMAASPRNYVLRRLDSLLAGTEANYQQRMMTVEHVLPRTVAPNSEWARWYPTPEARARWVHKLGNLALLSRYKNQDASNYDFARKKQIYFAPRNGIAPYALTAQILLEEAWTPDVIERRQKELLEHLKQLWLLEPVPPRP